MNLNIFFKENNIQQSSVKYVASNRFKDETGKAVEWELKVLKNTEIDILKNRYTKKEINKKGISSIVFDNKGFVKSIVTSCIKYPDLNNKELQDSYEVMDSYELLKEILTVGEFNALEEKILDLHDYEEKQEKEEEDIKN